MNESLKELAVRYFEGPIAPEEECELFGFLAASPENAALMREWEREWKQRHVPSADVLRSLARLNGKIERRENRIRARRRWLRFSAAAAVLILISAFTTRHLIHTEDPVQMFSVQAPQGTNSRISLPDGSQVWLNAGSTLNYRSDFNRSSRDIGLPHIAHRGAGHRINHGRVVRHPADQRQARHLRLPRRQPPPKNRTLKKLLSKQT